ncbi:hypothetical protein [Bradyrhizobium sp. CCBAU 51745]|uniref:hypothetical protein n=1 Tax=Bradyrhizobium sp. CCBAU 51745 TaxID=1325099 RepID=UPI002306606F|nr:hypothetical protein [Bradyrhizobium sp. CCBAU 51745]
MPLARYFLYFGGALIVLLFILDARFPTSGNADGPVVNAPVVHIRSDRKWPERIVFDTSAPTIPVARNARAESVAPTISPPLTEELATTRSEAAFAKMVSFDESKANSTTSIKREVSRRAHNSAKKVAARSHRSARQAWFGWLGNGTW